MLDACRVLAAALALSAVSAGWRDSGLAAQGDSGWRQLHEAVRLLRQDVVYGGQRPVQEGDCEWANNP
jgi:hypothetical protein